MESNNNITYEAIDIIESARLLSGNNQDLFKLHIKYFCDNNIVMQEIKRLCKIYNIK